MNYKDKQALAEELKSQGFALRDIGTWPAKTTYYTPDGRALPNLPAEPSAMAKYVSKKRKMPLLLVKPTEEQIATYIFGKHPELLELFAPPAPRPSVMMFACDTCRQEFSSKFALAGHAKSHNAKGKSKSKR